MVEQWTDADKLAQIVEIVEGQQKLEAHRRALGIDSQSIEDSRAWSF